MTVKDHPLYPTWHGMIQRCSNPNNNRWEAYGGRGIKVCNAWKDFNQFVKDVGAKPGPGYTLDRRDVNSGYEPSNTRWATITQQNQNARSNRVLFFEGQSKCLSAWAREKGIAVKTLWNRLYVYGWDVERALSHPARKWTSRAFRDSLFGVLPETHDDH